MKTDNIKGLKSVDLLVIKEGNLIKSIDKYITKKDLKREIKLYIKADKDGFGSNCSLNINLYKGKDDKRELINNERVTLIEGDKNLEIPLPLKEFIKGNYQYEIEDENSKEKIVLPFQLGKEGKKIKKFLLPVIVVLFTVAILSQVNIDFSFNKGEADTIKDNGPLDASGGSEITSANIKDKTDEEVQEELDNKSREINSSWQILPSTIIFNQEGVGQIGIGNPERSKYTLSKVDKKDEQLAFEADKVTSEIFSTYEILYLYNRIEENERIIFYTIPTLNGEFNEFKITLYNKEEEMLYETNMIEMQGSKIEIILKEKLSEQPYLYRLQLYNSKNEVYNIYEPILVQEEYTNEIPVQFVILNNEGKELYVSPLVKPGEFLNAVTLSELLPVGNYDISFRYDFYDKEGKCYANYVAERKLKVV